MPPLPDVHLTNAWKVLIVICHLACPYGTISVEIQASEPRRILDCHRLVDCSRPETLTLIDPSMMAVKLDGAKLFDELLRGSGKPSKRST